MPTFEPRVTAEVPREPLPGTPGSIRLGTLKTLSASKLGVKYSLFILHSNSLIFGDWRFLIFFSGVSSRGTEVQKEGRMSYADFVWLLISEEDKRSATR